MLPNKISFEEIISVENLLSAWKEFLVGKKNRKDVQEFQLRMMDSVLLLHSDLKNKTYVHGGYQAFSINDPKPRNIHKAFVGDRLLHHALYRVLYPYFDKKFIHDSYSCRVRKGTHKALDRFNTFARKVSKNNTQTCWVLKCDVRKFFASIDQVVLLEILRKHIDDTDTLWLLERLVESFDSGKQGVGLPLGNLTSQLLVNIYMNEFDQYMKHIIKEKYYIRYADDFVILNADKKHLEKLTVSISDFLNEKLKLTLHPNKVFIKTFASGVDFLGWIHFPYRRIIRTVTKKRMFKKLSVPDPKKETIDSYKGLLGWGNAYELIQKIDKIS
ncbi:MAG: reverse transcriptase/maturase family protein [Candidatus Zambryskibacteria bacterium]|nr:reverse transcriptase/maturase family protein [Candidatus Zambryskibacteria bacterium]